MTDQGIPEPVPLSRALRKHLLDNLSLGENFHHHTRLIKPCCGNELRLFFGTVCSFATQIVGITQVLQRQRERRANFVSVSMKGSP